MLSPDVLLTGFLALAFATAILALGWLGESGRRTHDSHGVAAE